MKKIAVLLLTGLLAVSFTACSSEDEASSDSSNSSVSSEISTTGEIGDLLMNSFGKLFTDSSYCIDVSIFSESYSSDSTNSEDTIQYSYEVAVDVENQKAGLDISTDGQNVSIVIKDGIGYEINHDDKLITTHTSDVDVQDFADSYTTYLYIGTLSGITLSSSGITKYNDTECNFERYILSADDISDVSNVTINTATITYYFKDGVPIAEALESTSGKTTFTFNKVSNDIDESIFDIPDDYETVSGDTSSESESSE